MLDLSAKGVKSLPGASRQILVSRRRHLRRECGCSTLSAMTAAALRTIGSHDRLHALALDDVRALVADEVRAWMARRKITGEKLAAELGKSGTTVSRRLRGRTAFDLDDLHEISVILNVPLERLLLPALQERMR